MKPKLIKTKDYLLLIDEKAEIKEGDYYFSKNNNIVTTCDSKEEAKECAVLRHNDFKIIAYYPLSKEAEELDLPLLPNPFKEKEIDAEKLACNIYNLSLDEYEYINENLSQNRNLIEEHYKDINREEIAERYFDVISFIAGYNAAQSKQFSLEDMRNMFILGGKHKIQNPDSFLIKMEEILEFLSTQQLPKEFIPEYEDVFNKTDSCSILDNNYHTHSKKLKTITNSEGKEVLVGTYKY